MPLFSLFLLVVALPHDELCYYFCPQKKVDVSHLLQNFGSSSYDFCIRKLHHLTSVFQNPDAMHNLRKFWIYLKVPRGLHVIRFFNMALISLRAAAFAPWHRNARLVKLTISCSHP